MTPQALKASVLQLAIQGKLVPQRPEEGTAEELYQQIQAEKQQLIANGTIKREKPCPPIKEDEIPFDIPETWKWVRLGEIGSTNIGLTYSPKDISPAGTIVLRSCNIQDGQMRYDDIVRVAANIPANKMCRMGDILICARNGSKRLVGKAALIDREGMSFGAFMAVFRSACNRYIVQVINSSYFRNTLLDDSSTTTINQLTQDMLKNFVLPLPPLEEQKRIVAKIEEMLPLIDRYGEAHTELETFNKRFPDDLRKSILQEAIQGKLVPQRPEEGTAEELYQQIQAEKKRLIAAGTIKKEKPLPPIEEKDLPFDIPETWKWVRLGEIFTLQAGKFIAASEIQEKNNTTPYPCYGGNGCRGYVQSYNRDGDYPLIGRQGALCGNINRAQGKFYATEHAVAVEVYANTDVAWACLFLQALNLNQYATATAQPGLAVSKINEVLIPLPPLAEQQRIVAQIEELLALCKSMQ